MGLGLTLSALVTGIGVAATIDRRPVTPASLVPVLASAKGGETITLAEGDYGTVAMPARTFSPSLKIDARRARFTGLTLRNVKGVEITGGVVRSPTDQNFAVIVDFAQRIRLSNMAIGGARIAVAISRSQDIDVIGNDFAGTRSDGVNVAMSQRVRIERNQCRDFRPIEAVYAADGKLVRDGDHPDCVQAWSAQGYPVTSDLIIVGNTASGFMQGFFIANPHNGPEQRPFERVTVKDNILTLSAFNGIVLKNVQQADVSGNTVNTVKGSVLGAFPHPPIKAWVRVTGAQNRVCGNAVQAEPKGEGTTRCR